MSSTDQLHTLFQKHANHTAIHLPDNTSITYKQLLDNVLTKKQTLPKDSMITWTSKGHLEDIILYWAIALSEKTAYPQNKYTPTTNTPNPTHLNTLTEPPATLLKTSGSTATPKIAIHSHTNHLSSAQASMTHIPLTPEDSWLLNLPLYHVSGLSTLYKCLLSGASISLNTDHYTHRSMVPTQLQQAIDTNHTFPSSLKSLLIGGSSISNTLYETAKNLPLQTTYGLTEYSSQVATSAIHSQEKQLLPNLDIKLGQNNEIFIKGPSLFQGYLTPEGISKPTDQDGYYHTKDLGKLNSTTLTITGRQDNLFISGGENIQPEEIENVLLNIPEVKKALIVPIPDITYGQRPIAFIDPLTDLNIIKSHLEKTLEPYKHPDHIYNWPTELSQALKPSRKLAQKIALKLTQ